MPEKDDGFVKRMGDRGEHCSVSLAQQVNKQWATPDVSDRRSAASKQQGLSNQVQWATPRSGKTTDENPETWRKRQERGEVATMPLTAQVKEDWGTPSVTSTGGPTGLGGGSGNKKKMNALGEEGRQMCTAKLNSRWVECLMGVPFGHVSIEPVTPTTCTNRTDELRLLGNGIVPATAMVAITTLSKRLTEGTQQ